METTIKNVEDLDKKGGTEGIKYGCVTDQSTASFFQVGAHIFFSSNINKDIHWNKIIQNNTYTYKD